MSPVRGAGGDDHYADRNDPRRGAAAAAAVGADDDEERGTPDAFDDLKAKLSDMTNKLGSLVGKDKSSEAPVAEQADIDADAPGESSGMARLARLKDSAPEAPAEPASAADRVALALGVDEADEAVADPTDEALEAPELLGQQVLQAKLDGDVNDNGIIDKFDDDLPSDDGTDDDDGGLEFASLDFDGE